VLERFRDVWTLSFFISNGLFVLELLSPLSVLELASGEHDLSSVLNCMPLLSGVVLRAGLSTLKGDSLVSCI
jgi:hypothetical protein